MDEPTFVPSWNKRSIPMARKIEVLAEDYGIPNPLKQGGDR
jgi:hypothetical protein